MKRKMFRARAYWPSPPGAGPPQDGRSAPADGDGFIPLFNGKDLTNWDGLDGFWSVQGRLHQRP